MSSKVFFPQDMTVGEVLRFVLVEEAGHFILYCGRKLEYVLVEDALTVLKPDALDPNILNRKFEVRGGGNICLSPTMLRAWGRSENFGSPPRTKIEEILTDFKRVNHPNLRLELDSTWK